MTAHRTILEPFQVVGRDFLASRFHALLADEAGIGKTIQSLHAASAVGAESILVTCPASVRTNWHEHAEAHYANDVLAPRFDVISYNGASNPAVLSTLAPKYDVWIGDECHLMKGLGSRRCQALFGDKTPVRGEGLARRAKYKWALSGTVAPNYRPVELYPLLKALHTAFAGYTFDTYTREFCGAFWEAGRGLNTKGATSVEKLSSLLSSFMLRRLKVEVFPGRKEPLEVRIPVDLTAEDLAAVTAETDAIGGRECRLSPSIDKFSAMGDTSKLLRLLGEAKANAAAFFIQDKLEGGVKKMVVFAYHKEVIKRLQNALHLSGYAPVIYAGGMSDGAKDKAKRTFMEGEKCRVFIGQRDAAGTGINGLQTVCDTIVDVEPGWTPGYKSQRIDRLDRMGQKSDIVTVYQIYARKTLDVVVCSTSDRKVRVGERLFILPGAESTYAEMKKFAFGGDLV